MTATLYSITAIVFDCSDIEVIWIDANFVVAFVEDAFVIRHNRPNKVQ